VVSAVLEVRGISVAIDRKRIVEDVSAAARAGEVLAIVGPNGSGKTTLMKALSGELAHDGEIALNGRPLRTLPPRVAATIRAVMPQASVLSFPFTVREVVRLGLSAGLGVMPAQREVVVEAALRRVDLAGFGGRMYQSLSGGEQQRVQLARVLCQVWQPLFEGTPRLLLLDEPVSSLDIRHQLLVMELARDFAAAGGAVIAILHDLNLAALYADQVLVMSQGRCAACGAPADVLDLELVREVFGCELTTLQLPNGAPLFAPVVASRLAAE
jgi:iron complex transport system ATP-binding protein